MQIKEDILESQSVQLYPPRLCVGQSGTHFPNSLLKEIVNYKYDQIIHTFFPSSVWVQTISKAVRGSAQV